MRHLCIDYMVCFSYISYGRTSSSEDFELLALTMIFSKSSFNLCVGNSVGERLKKCIAWLSDASGSCHGQKLSADKINNLII